MRIALITEGGYPYAHGESVVWCDRLVRGLAGHEFEIYALSRSQRQEGGPRYPLPHQVRRVRCAPLWGPEQPSGTPRVAAPVGRPLRGRRARARFAEHFEELVSALCTAAPGTGAPGTVSSGTAAPATSVSADPDVPQPPDALAGSEVTDRFAAGLYGLAELARECGGLGAALRSESAVRQLEAACRRPGALRAARTAQVAELLAVADRLERALRPLSLAWYGAAGDPGLSTADLCHVVGGGPAALPGLLAKRFFDVPLLVTEYAVRLREHYLRSAAQTLAPVAAGAPVRALLASFQARLVRETYRQAALITPGNSHARRWQERCGAERGLRTVYAGMDAGPFAAVGASGRFGALPYDRRPTLVWVGRIEPDRDLIALLHAFAEVRRQVPDARLLIVESGPEPGLAAGDPEAATYRAHCRTLAAQLFPDESTAPEAGDLAAGGAVPRRAVVFRQLGGPEVPSPAHAYAAATVVVRSSVLEGFPVSLVQAMFCGRPTVSTDAGAVREVVGETGLVVPPRNPRALAESCTALLNDPGRRDQLGRAARLRALRLFTVEQNVSAFHGIYLELMSRRQAPVASGPPDLGPRPFARPPEAQVPGRWAAGDAGGRRGPRATGWGLARAAAGSAPGPDGAEPLESPAVTVESPVTVGGRPERSTTDEK